VAALVALISAPALADRGGQRDNRRGEAKAQVDCGLSLRESHRHRSNLWRRLE
jgi:hypothetical protein